MAHNFPGILALALPVQSCSAMLGHSHATDSVFCTEYKHKYRLVATGIYAGAVHCGLLARSRSLCWGPMLLSISHGLRKGACDSSVSYHRTFIHYVTFKSREDRGERGRGGVRREEKVGGTLLPLSHWTLTASMGTEKENKLALKTVWL